MKYDKIIKIDPEASDVAWTAFQEKYLKYKTLKWTPRAPSPGEVLDIVQLAHSLIDNGTEALRDVKRLKTPNITEVQLCRRLNISKYWFRNQLIRNWEEIENPNQRALWIAYLREEFDILKTKIEADLIDQLQIGTIKERTGIFILKAFYGRYEVDVQMTGDQSMETGDIVLRKWDGTPLIKNLGEGTEEL